MRYDMGKCVIERPRRNSSARSAKARWYGKFYWDEEDGLEYEGMSHLPVSRKQEGYFKSKIGSKDFSDLLGPIQGYLASSAGRPWDDVFSELSRGLGGFSWPLQHILEQHIDVAVKTYRGIDGNIWHLGKFRPEKVDGSYGTEFYVEPETKLLRVHPDAWTKRWYARSETGPELYWKVAAGHDLAGHALWYVCAKGLWFLGKYEDAPALVNAEKTKQCGYSVYGGVEWPDLDVGRGMVKIFRRLKSCSKREIREIRKKLAKTLQSKS